MLFSNQRIISRWVYALLHNFCFHIFTKHFSERGQCVVVELRPLFRARFASYVHSLYAAGYFLPVLLQGSRFLIDSTGIVTEAHPCTSRAGASYCILEDWGIRWIWIPRWPNISTVILQMTLHWSSQLGLKCLQKILYFI